VFRPERFINKQGELVKDDWLLNFGVGKLVTLFAMRGKTMQNSFRKMKRESDLKTPHVPTSNSIEGSPSGEANGHLLS